MAKDMEACGRCSMTVVVDAAEDEDEDGASGGHDPFGEERIEVAERDVARVSPEAWIGRVSSRVDSVVSRIAWRQ